MKKLKRMLAVLLTAIMTLAMATTAFAAETTPTPAPGNLTVSVKSPEGFLNGQRIYLFKLFNYTSKNPTVYTATENYKEKLKNVLNTNTSDDYELYSAIAALKGEAVQTFANNFTKQIIKGGVITGNLNTDYKVADIEKKAEKITSYVFNNVDPGYYLVYLGGSATIQSSLVTVDSNATVELKSETPTPDKTASKPDVQIGNVLTYTVKTKVPDISAFNPTNYEFILKDTLSTGLDFVKDANGTAVEGSSMPVKVTVNNKDYTPELSATVNDKNMTLDLSDVVKNNQNANIGAEIVVTYYAKVNESADMNNTQNEAKLEYSNDPETNGKGESLPDIVKTPTFPINVHKFEQGKETGYLAGAKFQLCKDTAEGTVIKMAAENSNGKYVVAEDQNAGGLIEEMTTVDKALDNGNYNLQINGLAAGTYYLVETEAPVGFNKKTPIKIEIINTTKGDVPSYDIKVDDSSTAAENDIVKVENRRGTILPGTGGMGTVLFTVIGVALVLIVVASFVISRRKRAE